MRIEFACPFCRKPHSVEPALAGRRGRCKDCGTVMRIPGERAAAPVEKSRTPEPASARVKAPEQAAPRPARPPAPSPRSKPESVPELELVLEIDDPYGLVEEPAAPRPSRPRNVDVEGAGSEYAPLPRAGVEPSPSRTRRHEDEEPWGLSIRRTAWKLTAVGFVQACALQGIRTGGLSDPWLSVRRFGIIEANGLIVIAAALSVVSLIGAAVSLSRGNRRAFSGESALGQCGWFVTIFVSISVACIAFNLVPSPGRAVLRSWDARLSVTEKADIAVYEHLLNKVLVLHDRLARLMEKLVVAEGPAALALQTDQLSIQRDHEGLMREVAATPMPTRGQVKQLFDRYHGRVLAALLRTSQGMHDVVASVNLPPDSDAVKAVKKSEADTAKLTNVYKSLYPAGATDSTGWYFAVFGPAVAPRG